VADDAEAIKADIELTRAELARTVDALHTKLDVKTQAKTQLDDFMARMYVLAEENRTALMAGGAVLLALIVFRRGRKRD
jgi:hypothetical protein